jgi:hypothetical protein
MGVQDQRICAQRGASRLIAKMGRTQVCVLESFDRRVRERAQRMTRKKMDNKMIW